MPQQSIFYYCSRYTYNNIVVDQICTSRIYRNAQFNSVHVADVYKKKLLEDVTIIIISVGTPMFNIFVGGGDKNRYKKKKNIRKRQNSNHIYYYYYYLPIPIIL